MYTKPSRLGKNLYLQFTKVLQFDQIMRQQGKENERFRNILNRAAEGKLTEDDWKNHLCPRQLSKLPAEEQEWFKNNATKLCTTNKDLKKFNIQHLKKLGTPIAQIHAINKGPGSKMAKSENAEGLQNTILLAEGAKVMCTFNVAKSLGVVNGNILIVVEVFCYLTFWFFFYLTGSIGEVVRILYRPGSQPPNLPDIVYVKFPDYTGESALKDEGIEKVVAMTPRTAEFNIFGKHCSRTSYPLQPAYSLTIHKGQGNSIVCFFFHLIDFFLTFAASFTFRQNPAWCHFGHRKHRA